MGQVLVFLLDSDFVSQPTKVTPHEGVIAWLRTTKRVSTFVSVVTLHEIQHGIDLMPEGRKRRGLLRWFEEELLKEFALRTLDVTPEIARESGRLVARAKLEGHTADLGDAMIAATARVTGLRLASLNRKHFLRLGVEPIAL